VHNLFILQTGTLGAMLLLYYIILIRVLTLYIHTVDIAVYITQSGTWHNDWS